MNNSEENIVKSELVDQGNQTENYSTSNDMNMFKESSDISDIIEADTQADTQQESRNSISVESSNSSLEHPTSQKEVEQSQPQSFSSSEGNPHHNNHESPKEDTQQSKNSTKTESAEINVSSTTNTPTTEKHSDDCGKKKNSSQSSGAVSFHSSAMADAQQSSPQHFSSYEGKPHCNNDSANAESMLHGNDTKSSTSTAKNKHNNSSEESDVTSGSYSVTRNKGGDTFTKDSIRRQKKMIAHAEESFVQEKVTTPQDNTSSAHDKLQSEAMPNQGENMFFDLISDNIEKQSNSINEMKEKKRRDSRSSSFIDTLNEPADQLHSAKKNIPVESSASTGNSLQDPIQSHRGGRELISRKDVVSASPASTLKYASLPSGLLVTSTSSRAGLPDSKFKRLWPDSSIFSKRILKWTPPGTTKDFTH